MRVVFTLFFLLMYQCMFGQHELYEKMLHKPYKDIAGVILDLSLYVENIPDSITAFAFIDDFRKWAEQHNDTNLVLESEMLRAYYQMTNHYPANRKILDFKALAVRGKVEGMPMIEARAGMEVANFYWRRHDYQTAFNGYMYYAQILNRIDPEEFPLMAVLLNNIGRAYYYFGDYEEALLYFKKAGTLKRNSVNNSEVLNGQNNVGLCYQKTGQFELSNEWFTRIMEDSSQFQSWLWKGVASGNLGYNYYLQGGYKEAIPLLKTDVAYALKVRGGKVDYALASGSTTALADIYLKMNLPDKSKIEIDAAKEYIRICNEKDRLRLLYPIMSRWFARNGQFDSSEVYLELAVLADKKYNEKFSSLKLMRADQEYRARQKELELAQLKTEGQLKLAERNLITAITVLLLIGTLLLFWFRNKYLIKKQQIKELALVNTREALVNAKSQLENMVQRVNQNNEMIIQLQKGNPNKEDADLLERLKSTSILTQSDWAKYQDLFNKIYPKFLPNLDASCPDLSPAEKRCLCLEKLQMSNNEMALVLGVSANTVIVTKHRIRKKLDLVTQTDLTEFIENLN